MMRMRKPYEHVEEEQKSVSTELLRQERAWLSHKRKKNACEFIIHRAISKGEMARSLLGIYLR